VPIARSVFDSVITNAGGDNTPWIRQFARQMSKADVTTCFMSLGSREVLEISLGTTREAQVEPGDG